MKRVAVVVFTLLVYLSFAEPSSAQRRPPKPPKPDPVEQQQKAKCETQCDVYKRFMKTEAAEVATVTPRPRYVMIDSKEAVLRVRLLSPHPEVNQAVPPVDDELRVYVNGNQTWEVLYGSASNRHGTEYVLTADQLPLRNANVVVRWRTTVGPDAHFFVELGGTLVCPTDGWCGQTYREGLNFGSRQLIIGPLSSIIGPQTQIDLLSAWIWRSAVDPYPQTCTKYHKCE